MDAYSNDFQKYFLAKNHLWLQPDQIYYLFIYF